MAHTAISGGGWGHPEGQQLWHLKLLALKLAEESLAGGWGGAASQSTWGPKVMLSQTCDAPEASRRQAPPQKRCLYPSSYCSRKPSRSSTHFPSLRASLPRPTLEAREAPVQGEGPQSSGPGPEDREHQEQGRAGHGWPIPPAGIGEPTVAPSAVPHHPILVGSRAALTAP